MRWASLLSIALLGMVLVLAGSPALAAPADEYVVGGTHTTETDFGDAPTLRNFTVRGSRTAASLQAEQQPIRPAWSVRTALQGKDGTVPIRQDEGIERNQGHVYQVTSTGRSVEKRDATDGSLVWETNTSSRPFAITVGPRRVYVGLRGTIIALDKADGSVLWRNTDPGRKIRTLHYEDDDEIYWNNRFDKNIGRLNSTGETIWYKRRFFGSELGSFVSVDGELFVRFQTDEVMKITESGNRAWGASNGNGVDLVAADGFLWLLDTEQKEIDQFDTNGNLVAEHALPDGVAPIELGASDHRLWVSTQSGSEQWVRTYDTDGQVQERVSTSSTVRTLLPADRESTVWIRDTVNAETDTLEQVQTISPNIAASGRYVSAEFSVGNAVQAWTNLTARNASVTIRWEYWTGTSWTTAASRTVSSSGNYTFDISAAAGADRVRTVVSYETTGPGAAVALSDEGVRFEPRAPQINSSTATPVGGIETNNADVTLSVDISDADLGDPQGDRLQAEVYFDGSQLTTTELTANGTVSTTARVETGGEHTWHVEVTDRYGRKTRSDGDSTTPIAEPFRFKAPSQLRIYNESAPETLLENVQVSVQFYGGETGESFTADRETTTGVVNMTGLPVTQEFVVVATAPGYHDRRIYVENLYEQAAVFLLPESRESLYNVFTLEDKSGAFPPGETRLLIQRTLNRSGQVSWQTVSGDFFGASNEYKTYLRSNRRYRLIVENNQGDRRLIGSYQALDEVNPKILTIEEIIVKPAEGQRYRAHAFLEDGSDETESATLRFAYEDPEEVTESLQVRIYERGNESNVLDVVETTEVEQSWTYTYTLTGDETDTQWVVEWRGQREGREIGQTVPLGPGGSGAVSLPLPDEWLVRFALVALPIVAALASERLATLGALGTVAFAGMLRLLGIWELPVVLWFAALVIALGGHALTIERRGGAVG